MLMPVDVDLINHIRAAQRPLPETPASHYGARRSRAHQPSTIEARLEESAPPFAALPGGGETAGRSTARPSSGRRISDGAFTRAAAIAPFVVAAAISAIALTNSVLTADLSLFQILKSLVIVAVAGGAVAAARIPVGRYFVQTRVAVLGPASSAYELDRKIADAGGHRYSVIGHVALPGQLDRRSTAIDLNPVSFRVRPLGELDDLDAIVEQNHIDLIVLARDTENPEGVKRAVDRASRLKKRLTSLDNFERPANRGVSAKRFFQIIARFR